MTLDAEWVELLSCNSPCIEYVDFPPEELSNVQSKSENWKVNQTSSSTTGKKNSCVFINNYLKL